jgi:hypothetical protein
MTREEALALLLTATQFFAEHHSTKDEEYVAWARKWGHAFALLDVKTWEVAAILGDLDDLTAQTFREIFALDGWDSDG